MERIPEKELQPLEARIESMVQDITRNCLSDLVRDWQTSEFVNTGSYQSSSHATGPTNEAPASHNSTYLDQNSSWIENTDLDTRNRREMA